MLKVVTILVLCFTAIAMGDIVTTHIKPKVDDTLDLGTTTEWWRYIYGHDIEADDVIADTVEFGSVKITTTGGGFFLLPDGTSFLLLPDDASKLILPGSAATGQVFYYDSDDSLTSEAAFSYDEATNTLTVGTFAPTNPVTVPYGGTGVATLTDHALIAGSGVGALTSLAAAIHGQIPIGSTGADPVLNEIDGTANQVTVTNAAGTITLSTPQDIAATSSPTFKDITLTGDVDAVDFTADNYFRSNTSKYVRLHHVGLYGASPGASGATFVPPDVNRTGGWQLDTDTEYVYGESVIHGDWDGATDPFIQVHFTINTAGANAADTCDWVVEFYYKGDGEDECKRQTVEGAKTVGTASQYTQFSIDIPLNWDLVDNVLQEDDTIGVRFNLETDTSEVDDVTITNVSFQYKTSHLGMEDGDI